MTSSYLEKSGEIVTITDAGFARLREMVTNMVDDVYVINGMSPVMAAAGMARLSRSPNDMRIVILDEFADATGEDQELIKRVITGYGDDSVQQLIGIQFVVENASNWLTKRLEWGRFGAYLEQSTRYIYFDQRDAEGRYRYFVPESMSGGIRQSYVRQMDAIFDAYSNMVRGVSEYVREQNPQGGKPRGAWMAATRAQACDAVRPVLPVATTSTVGIFMSAQAVDNLIMDLLSQDMPEAVKAGEAILREARKVIPAFLERTDIPERGGARIAYKAETRRGMKRLAEEMLAHPSRFAQPEEEVILQDYWPRDEHDLIRRLLFSQSRHTLGDLWNLPPGNLEEILDTYVGNRLGRRMRPGRAIEKAHYEWEIVGDYGTFRDLQRHRVVDAFEWQNLTPHLGYDVPELVIDAGFENEFRSCFDISEELYTDMVGWGFGDEAQYATLLGHRMRYSFIANLRELYHLLELRSGPTGHPGYRRIALKMYEELKRVHPMLASGMKFIGQDPDNDTELTRMAAELATHDKLDRLGRLSSGDAD